MRKEKEKPYSRLRSPKSGAASPDSRLAALRKRAGEKLRDKTDRLEELSTQDVKTIVHDLGTYQIELEMQNEELRRSQQEIETSQRSYADLYDFAPIAYFILDEKTRIVSANLAAADLLGKKRNILGKMQFRSFVSMADRGAFDAHCRRTIEDKGLQSCEVRLKGPGGATIFARLQSIPEDSKNSGPVMLKTAVTDITKLRQAEELTRHLASFPQLNPNPVLELDHTGKIVFANMAAGDALEKLDMNRGDLRPFLPSDMSDIIAGLKKKPAAPFTCELKIKDKVFAETIQIVPQFNVVRLYIRDITDRRQIEEKLRTSELQFRLITETSPDVIFQMTPEGRMTYCSPASRSFGYDPEQVVGEPFSKFVHQDDLAEAEDALKKLNSGEAVSSLEIRLLRADLSPVICEIKMTPMIRNGLIAGIQGITRDISDRKRAEEELIRAKDELELRVKERTVELFEKSRILEAFFRHTQTSLVFLDRDFNFIRVNNAYAKACSRPLTDFEGHNHFIDYPSAELKEKFSRVVETKQPFSIFGRPFTFPDHPEWGTTYWDLTLAPVLNAEGEVDFLVFSLLDVTESKLALEQVHSMKRLYSMLSSVNEAIMRIHDPERLYHEICRISVEKGRFKMAWIGLTEHATRKVAPVASYGDTGGYMETITIYASDILEGSGPTGRAIREGKYMICSDIEYDPIMLPWKDEALSHGFRSLAAIPISEGGHIIGALTIYADTPKFFNDEELDPLISMTDNISFALDAMSNEKRRLAAEKTLLQTAEEIHDLYNNAPCGYHSLDKNGTIIRINDTELKWLGYTRKEVIGNKKIYEFFTPEGVERFRQSYPAFVETGSLVDLEFDLVRNDGTIFSVLLNGTAIRDKDGNFLMSRSTMFDVTARNEAEQRLRVNSELLKLFAQKNSLGEYLNAVSRLISMWSECRHVGFRIVDENKNIPFLASIDYDPGFLRRESELSLAHDQCICTRVISGSPELSDLVCMTPSGSFISENTESFTKALTAGQRSKYRGVCMQTGFRTLAVVPIRYRDKVLGAIHIADERENAVTVKKIEFIEQLSIIVGEAVYRFSAEEELKKSREALRNLSTYMREAREEERTRIAREIHDELGQIVTALRLDLAWIRDTFKDQEVIFNKAKSMLTLVDATIQTVNNIITELRPGMLDVLGLFAAIEWQASELEKMSGITCDLALPAEDVELSAETSTNIFRIIQELFTNIARHSKATAASVQIEIKKDRLFLKVSDNGVGTKPQDISNPVSFGIIGIKERVYAMKGDMNIEGKPGRGTTVVIMLPVQTNQDGRRE